MTGDRESLLAAVRASTADDLPRLVMADLLDERGEYDRAEFIRVQCELASAPELVWANRLMHEVEWRAVRHHAERWGERFELSSTQDRVGVNHYRTTNPKWRALHERERELLRVRWADEPVPPQSRPDWLPDAARSAFPWDVGGWEWHRGFVRTVRGPLRVLLAALPSFVRAEPVERVEVTDREPESGWGRYGTLPVGPTECVWYRWETSTHADREDIPAAVWDRLAGYRARDDYYAAYPGAGSARSALSDALIAWALVQPADFAPLWVPSC